MILSLSYLALVVGIFAFCVAVFAACVWLLTLHREPPTKEAEILDDAWIASAAQEIEELSLYGYLDSDYVEEILKRHFTGGTDKTIS